MFITDQFVLIILVLLIIDTTTAKFTFTNRRPIIGSNGYDKPVLGFSITLMTKPDGQHFCGGAIISPHWILTAASCVHNRLVSSFSIGMINDYYQGKIYSTETVDQIVVHPEYSAETNENNIALVRVDGYIRDDLWNDIIGLTDKPLANWTLAYINSLKPDTDDKNFDHRENTLNTRTISLQQCTAMILSATTTMANNTNNNNSTNATTKIPIINDNKICLIASKGKGVCYGDEGSPVTVDNLNQPIKEINSYKKVLVGIVSADLSCGLGGGRPDVVTSIRPYLQWINEKTNITAVSSSISITTTTTTTTTTTDNNPNPVNPRPILGFSDFSNRLISYSASLINEFNEHYCGGAIISPYWILTAASCVYNHHLSGIFVGVGRQSFIQNVSYYGVDQIIINDQYSPVTKQHNIALVRVQPYLGNDDYLQIVELVDIDNKNNQSIIANGIEAIIAGCASKSRFSRIFTAYSQYVHTVDWQQCLTSRMTTMANDITITITNNNNTDSSHLCLVANNDQSTCKGDEGSPVVVSIIDNQIQPKQQRIGSGLMSLLGNENQRKKSQLLIGILSSDLTCGTVDGGGGQPNIVTSVAPYRQWIKEKTGI